MTTWRDMGRCLALASLVPLVPKMNAAQNDPAAPQYERYVQLDSNIVYDKATNLEWLAGPNVRTTREGATAWVSGLSIAGGGWRMPTKTDIRGFYEHENDRIPTPLLKTTGSWVWTAEASEGPASSWGFQLDRSGELVMTLCKACDSRGLAVRAHKASQLGPALRGPAYDYFVGKDDAFVVYAAPSRSAVAFPVYSDSASTDVGCRQALAACTLSAITASEGSLLIWVEVAVDNRSNSKKRFAVSDIQIRANGKPLPITAVGFKDYADLIGKSERAKLQEFATTIESRADSPPTSYRFPIYIVEAPKGCDRVGLSFRGQKEVELRIATTP